MTTGGAGTLDLEGTNGNVVVNDNSALTTAGGDVRLWAEGSVAVAGVNASTGGVTITATTGSITDGGDTLVDVVASVLRLWADATSGGIGTSGSPITTTVATVAAAADAGGIYLKDTEAVAVDTVRIVSVKRVAADGTTSTDADSASTSDLVTTSNGNISLITTGGTITLNDGVNANHVAVSANGSGTVTLNAGGTNADLVINAAVNSGTGALTLTAARNVHQVASYGNLSTIGTGTISVTATGGQITMDDGTTTTTATGSISYTAGGAAGSGSVLLSQLTSTSGSLTVTSTNDGIVDNTLAETPNLTSAALATLSAATGIGSTGNGPAGTNGDINTSVDSLTATNSTSGGIFITEVNALTVTGGGVQTQGGNGPIVLLVTDGNLTTNGPISANGSGNVLVNVEGSGGPADMTVNAPVSSGSGNISLLANRNITFAGTGSGGGNVTVTHTLTGGTVAVSTGSGSGPFSIGINPVTNTIYVANIFNNTVTVINGATNATSTVPVGSLPYAIAVDSVTNKIYVANEGGNSVTVIDGATNATTTVSAGTEPYAIAVNSVTNKIYVANVGSDNVTVIDGATNTPTTVGLGFGTGPQAIAVDSVTNKIYVADDTNATVTIIDGGTNATSTVSAGSSPWAIAVNSVTNKIYVANYQASSVTVIDAANSNATSTISVGIEPDAIAVNSVTNTIYVVNEHDNTATVINGATGTVTTTVSVGTGPINAGFPYAVAVNSATDTVYVSNRHDGTVTVINGGTNATSTVAVGTSPTSVAVNSSTNTVYVSNMSDNTVTEIVGPSPPGTIDVQAYNGTITQGTGLVAQTDGGNISFKAQLDINLATLDARLDTDRTGATLTNQSTWGSVAVTSLGGNIYNTNAGGSAAVTVYGASARLQAYGNIGALGASVDPIQTELSTVAAETTNAGGISLLERTAVAVDTVAAIATNRVAADTTTSTTSTTTTALSDLATAGNGSIVLVTVNGTITLNDGTAPADGNAVNANGTGNVLVQAQGAGASVVANASVVSGSGNITILGAAAVTFNATGTGILTGGGTVDVEAGTSAITFDATSLVSTVQSASSGGAVRMLAATNVTLGGVTAGTANVSVTATSGTIYNAGNGTYEQNVVAAGLRLNAGTGVGLSGTHLITSVATLSASTGSGGIFITQQLAALAVDSVAVTVAKVGSDATTTAVTDLAQSDLVTSSNGSIVLQSTAGTITLNDGTAPANGIAVNASGTGNVLIQASGAGTDVVANASVVSGSGNITILGAAAVTFNATGTKILTGGGTVDVEAGTGAITFDATSLVSTVQSAASGGAVRMLAATNVTLGGVTAGTANVSVTATSGTIYNAGNGTYAQNVVASGLRLNAGTGVGLSGTHLITSVATLSASAGSGGIFITQQLAAVAVNSVAVTVAKVGSDATTSAATDAAQSDLVTGSNGSIVLQSAAGTITLNDGTAPLDGIAVNANGTGNVLIQAQGAGTDVLANANVVSGSGNITVLGARNVTFGASDSILTGGGTVDVEAGTGAITFAATSLVSTVQSAASGGAVRMLAATNATLGGVTAGTANVSVTATSGTIYNAGNGTYAQNVVASGLRLNAGTGVGLSGTHLITSVATLSASAGSGGIFITQQLQAVAVNSVAVTVAKVGSDATTSAVTDAAQSDLVTGSNGSIVLQSTAGTITLNDGTAPAERDRGEREWFRQRSDPGAGRGDERGCQCECGFRLRQHHDPGCCGRDLQCDGDLYPDWRRHGGRRGRYWCDHLRCDLLGLDGAKCGLRRGGADACGDQRDPGRGDGGDCERVGDGDFRYDLQCGERHLRAERGCLRSAAQCGHGRGTLRDAPHHFGCDPERQRGLGRDLHHPAAPGRRGQLGCGDGCQGWLGCDDLGRD